MGTFLRYEGKRSIEKRGRHGLRRVTAVMLCVGMLIPHFAQAVPGEGPALCEHHPEHDAICGYVEGVEARPCTHIHDGECGFQEAADGHACGHLHDEHCGHAPAMPEIPCDQGCSETDEEGRLIHQEGCAWAPAVEEAACGHVHDEACGYVEAVEVALCGHVHDEACG